MMFVPGALTSGLISKFGVDGPRELEEFTSSPAVCVLSNSLNKTVPAFAASAARSASPSVCDMSNVGRNSNASPRKVPEGPGDPVPPALLWIIVATAPASFAAATGGGRTFAGQPHER